MIALSLLLFAQRLTVVEPISTAAHLAAVQLDSSSTLSLISIDGRSVKVVASGMSIDIPGLASLFTVVDFDRDGYEELWVLSDGQSLQRLQLGDDGLLFSKPIAERLHALPPSGYHAAQFLNDFNGDGFLDLLLPVADKVIVHLYTEDGFARGLDLGALSRLTINNGAGLLSSTGRTLSVPGLRPEDVSGDGLPDLVVSENGHIRQYVATESGFPLLPTRTLNTNEFAKDLSGFELDMGNLSAGAAYLVQDKWADFDADGDIDVMILADHKVRIYLGNENGINLTDERQRLKVRGNVVYLFPARIDADEFPDLVIVRVEDVGLGKILRAALMSWKIDFDFMVFKGRGDGTFSKRAFRSKQATLKGDSLIKTYKEGKEDLSEMRKRIVRTCALDNDGQQNDLIILSAVGKLQVFKDLINTPNVLHIAIERFLQQSLDGDGDLDLQLTELLEWMLGRTSAMASLANGLEADMTLQLPDWKSPHAILIRDFDSDGHDEAMILRQHSQESGLPQAHLLSGFTIDFD
jgi:hypothetical protein